MISTKYLPAVQILLTATFMSFIMSFVISWINLGLIHGFIGIWMHAWLTAFVVAFPTLLLVVPTMRKLALRIASKQDNV